MKPLTAAQKRLYDSIKTRGWFTPNYVMLFTNYRSHLQKIEEKGFLESKLFPAFYCTGDMTYIHGTLKYKKVSIKKIKVPNGSLNGN
jgi:hypothetical protein